MKRIFTLILISVLCFSSLGCTKDAVYYENGEIVFEGSAIALNVRLYGGDEDGAYKEMVRTIKELDKELSLTNSQSTLTYFNETAETDEPVELSYHAYKIIGLGLETEEKTDGAFSIGALNINKIWNLEASVYASYNKVTCEPLEFDLPSVGKVKETLLNCDTSAVSLRDENGRYFISKSNKNLKIDLGAIAKGYCADLCYDIMGDYGVESGVINISGNVMLKGEHFTGKAYTAWLTGVDHPRNRFELMRGTVCAFELGGGVSVVTSGDYERFFLHESNITLCHIVNPVTGYPVGIEPLDPSDDDCTSYRMSAESVSSATIVYSSSALSDALSTALFVKGIEDGFEMLEKFDGIKAIAFTQRYSENDYYNGASGRYAVFGGIDFYEPDEFSGFKSYERYV